MSADPGFEEALEALLDGRPLQPLSGAASGDAPAGRSQGADPSVDAARALDPHESSPLAALRVLEVLGRAHHLALFGADSDPTDLGAIRRWGHLEVGEEIGRGATGTVYRAWDTKLAREVALKLFDDASTSSDTALAEGRLLARLRHPHIVTVFGADIHDGVAGVWMEFVRGDTLDHVLARDGVFGVEETLLVGIDLAAALAAVHAAGLLHRDVKARNVLRERGGRIVLMDLGAGRPADDMPLGGDATGTPLYMAPEVLAGGEASVRSDIYGLGVLLYRLLTGSFPVEAASLADLRAAHVSGLSIPLRRARPDLPLDVVEPIERAHDREAARRYQNAGETEAGLRVALARAAALNATVRTRRARTWARWRRPALTAGAMVAALSTALAVGWNTIPARTARRAMGLSVPPRSPLYLTIGGAIGIVRNGSLDLVPYNSADAMAIAVSSDLGIRTLAGKPPWTGGAWFDLDGTPKRPPLTAGEDRCCFYDGATDGQHNYAVRQDSTLLDPIGSRPVEPPTLYRFARDWSKPEPMFLLRPRASAPQVTSYYSGITYDPDSDSFWAPVNEPDGASIEQWSRDGRRLAAPVRVPWTVGGVAFDYADGTLWAIQYTANASAIRLDNFDRTGRYLGSVNLPRVTSAEGATGAEFAWTGR
jgi:serine/threonine-protein kinase